MKINIKLNQKTLLLVFYIYPILPLGLLAAWVLIIGGSSYISRPENLNGESVIYIGLFLLWFLGGVVGLYAGLKTLLSQNSKTVFWLFLYASLSYLVIAVTYVYEGFGYSLSRLFTGGRVVNSDIFNLTHTIYILVSLLIIGRQFAVIYRDAYGSPSQQSEPAPNIKNAHQGGGNVS